MRFSRPVHALSAFALPVLVAACSAPAESIGQADEDLTAPTCDPSLAVDAVPAPHRAMLDTIAYTEGTAGSCGQDGYSTGYAFNCFASCNGHPHIRWSAGSFTSSAAGRYQFLDFVWDEFNYPSFGPKYQDIAAIKLIQDKRQVYLPTDRALTATEFSNAMSKLSYEWASLPPFRYSGQGQHSAAEVRAKYCSFAGCDDQSGGGSSGGSCEVRDDKRLHCGNKAGAAIYDSPNFNAVVDRLRTTTSWFDCWSTGALHGGGNKTWYHTQGDDSGRWGWVPAADMKTTSEFDADPTSRGLPECQ